MKASTEIIPKDSESKVEENSRSRVVRCKKCPDKLFTSDAFDNHCLEHYVKETPVVKHNCSALVKGKKCEICKQTYEKKDYLSHLKEDHSNIILRCPLCTQTYHSPELLNVHYNHFHLEGNKELLKEDSPSRRDTHLTSDDIPQEEVYLEEG